MWRALAADYEAHYRTRPEPRWRRRVLAGPRFVLNPSLHAVVLIRLALAGPPGLLTLWRHALLAKHSIDLGAGCVLGPGLNLPHPFGIVLAAGTRVGANALVYHNVTVGGGWQGDTAGASVGDDVVLYANSVVAGGVRIGSRVHVSVNSFVDVDVPDDATFVRGGVVTRREAAAAP